MFRSTLALAALTLACAAAPAALSAQSATPADSTSTSAPAASSHKHHGHKLFRGITLTENQRTQLRAIQAKYKPQFHSAREANDRATMHQLRDQMVGEARGVLTPDQQTQFDANRAALKQHHKKQSAPAPTPAPST